MNARPGNAITWIAYSLCIHRENILPTLDIIKKETRSTYEKQIVNCDGSR